MEHSRLSRRRLLAAGGLAASAAIAGCSLESPSANESVDDFPTEFEPVDAPADLQVDGELSDLYYELVDSVVGIQIQEGDDESGGTGWLYQDNYVVTNEHITELLDPERSFVWFDEVGWRPASLVGEDVHSDLAVLEVEDAPESARPLPLVDTDEPPAVGTPVAAIGNPFDLTGSFTTGVISGRNRNIELPFRAFSIADGVQTDAALNPGNSGGPLVTFDAEVAGVVSAGQGENVGFAISASMTERVVPALIEDGEYEHTYLGVLLRDVSPEIVQANELGEYTWGVYVDEVLENTPADGDLQGTTDREVVGNTETPVGGDVIVGLDDETIESRERLSAYLALETDPGQSIDVTVVREGETVSESVTLAARPPTEEL